MSLKFDFHVHSYPFGKVYINEDQLRETLLRKNLAGAGITNFSNISHALWLKKQLKEFTIIVGQEVWSKKGHIGALGINERIPNFLSPQQTIERIHDQGGIAVAVHPYLHMGLGERVKDLPFDVIEEFNAMIGGNPIYNFLAYRMARKNKYSSVASSDTTDYRYVGHSCTEVLTDDPRDVLSCLKQRKVRLHKRPLPIPLGFIAKNLLRFRRLKPCSLHAAPCFVCGNSMAVHLFRRPRTCLMCSRTELSRIVCCEGHYFCIQCALGHIWNQDVDFSQKSLDFSQPLKTAY